MRKLWILLIIVALGFGAFAAEETAQVDETAAAVEEVTETVEEATEPTPVEELAEVLAKEGAL